MPPRARYALGIDGGGSKCDAAVLDEYGRVVGWGRGGPTHIYYDPPEMITNSYSDAVEQALIDIVEADIWVAGPLPEGPPSEAIERRNKLAARISASEVDTGYACAGVAWGLIVLSGTGSFIHGRSLEGRDLHFGGLGPILNDYGSGYAIGLAGLRAAFASSWAPHRKTSLAESILAALGCSTHRQVFNLVYLEGINRRRIAALAKVVNDAAEEGDRIAISCLQRAADELADFADDAIKQLGFTKLSPPAIAIGSIAQQCSIWWERMCERLRSSTPEIRPLIPQLAPAVGAALLALHAMNITVDDELRSLATRTQPAINGDDA